jgi:hypoxanthine phosphoribosyltransferase
VSQRATVLDFAHNKMASPLSAVSVPEWTNQIETVLFSEEKIRARVKEIAAEISRDYEGKNPILVCVLTGAFVFLADLVREITIPHSVDFVACSSYGSGTVSSGSVKILKDMKSGE